MSCGVVAPAMAWASPARGAGRAGGGPRPGGVHQVVLKLPEIHFTWN